MKTQAHQRYRSRIDMQKNGKGKIFPGVTTILDTELGWNKRTLINWARREAMADRDPDLVLQDAGDIGTLTHNMIEAHIRGEDADTSHFSAEQIKQAENGYLAFLEWEPDDIEYLYIEQEVISETLRYGGTLDIIAQTEGVVAQIDLKTSKYIYDEQKVQLAAYKYAYEEMIGLFLQTPTIFEPEEFAGRPEQIDECHILHLSKVDGSFVHYKIPKVQIWASFQIFKNCIANRKLKKELQ